MRARSTAQLQFTRCRANDQVERRQSLTKEIEMAGQELTDEERVG